MRPFSYAASALLLVALVRAGETPGTAPVPVPGEAGRSTDAAAGGSAESGDEDAAGSDARDDGTPGVVPAVLPEAPPDSPRGMDLMSRARLDMMVPPGRSHKGVHYPVFRPVSAADAVIDPVTGAPGGMVAPLDSLFESDLVTRLDSDHVQFDRARWVQFDAIPAPDGSPQPTMRLEIERGIYDLKNEILMTNQPVKIENQQFTLEGDSMLHDRASGLTRLTGQVKMTFFNEVAEPRAVGTPAPAPAPDAAAPAAPAATPASGSGP